MKGVCVPLTGDTPRIGAKRQIGIEESLGKCQETSLKYDIKERNNSSGTHPRILSRGCLPVTIRGLVGPFTNGRRPPEIRVV
jgi:hypothetical protein